ncbi:MAG: histidine phosphatase family protein [Anaerolineae bacterium]|nr:histidine phosphatase family protein [Anaerolineae bacterium]
MHLYLARHGDSLGSDLCRYGDFGLNDLGRQQAARLARQLAGVPFTHVYSSPLKRAAETAQIVVAERNLAVTVLDDLREVNVGAFDGLTFDQARAQYGWFFKQSRTRPTLDFRWPEGETTARVLDRARQTWDRLWQTHQNTDDVLLVISHTYYLNLFLLAALGLPFPNRFTFKVELAGCVHVAAEDGLPPWIVFDTPAGE